MESISLELTGSGRKPWLIIGMAISMGLLPAGCVTTNPFLGKGGGTEEAGICQAVAVWNPTVIYAPDPARGGTPSPGLVGRLYLFGPQLDFPRSGEGSLTIDLYKEGTKGDASTQVLLEEWHIDKETLQRLMKRDPIGCGYTLFLPWGTYHPELTHLHIKLRYEPVKGSPLYAPPSSLTLEGSGNPSQEIGSAGRPAIQRSEPSIRPAAAKASTTK